MVTLKNVQLSYQPASAPMAGGALVAQILTDTFGALPLTLDIRHLDKLLELASSLDDYLINVNPYAKLVEAIRQYGSVTVKLSGVVGD